MKQLPHVKKGVSEDQDIRSWGQTGRRGHLKSLNFHTPIRLAHNHFIATSHRGEMLAPQLMALNDKFYKSRSSKKGVSEDQDVRSWGQKGRSGHQKSLDFQTPFRLAHNHFIASSHRGEMLAPRLMALYYTCNSCRMSKRRIGRSRRT